MRRMLIALFLALPLAAAQAAEPVVVEQFRLWLDLDLDSHGRVMAATPVGKVNPDLADLVTQAAQQWTFRPMDDKHGVPAPSTTSTWVELSLLDPGSGELELNINRLYEGPRPKKIIAPKLWEHVDLITTTVPVEFMVETNGNPREITILQGGPTEDYNLAAMGAVRRMRFIPRTVAGEKTAVWAVFPVEFKAEADD